MSNFFLVEPQSNSVLPVTDLSNYILLSKAQQKEGDDDKSVKKLKHTNNLSLTDQKTAQKQSNSNLKKNCINSQSNVLEYAMERKKINPKHEKHTPRDCKKKLDYQMNAEDDTNHYNKQLTEDKNYALLGSQTWQS